MKAPLAVLLKKLRRRCGKNHATRVAALSSAHWNSSAHFESPRRIGAHRKQWQAHNVRDTLSVVSAAASLKTGFFPRAPELRRRSSALRRQHNSVVISHSALRSLTFIAAVRHVAGFVLVPGILLRELATWPASPFRTTMFALRRGIPTKQMSPVNNLSNCQC